MNVLFVAARIKYLKKEMEWLFDWDLPKSGLLARMGKCMPHPT